MLRGGVHFNLFNNAWGTNYIMWYGGGCGFPVRDCGVGGGHRRSLRDDMAFWLGDKTRRLRSCGHGAQPFAAQDKQCCAPTEKRQAA